MINMITRSRRLIDFEAVVLLGCALLISCAAGAFRGGHVHDENSRRGLMQTAGRQVFDVTKYGAVANNDHKDNVQVS